jgi:hypothetical protein
MTVCLDTFNHRVMPVFTVIWVLEVAWAVIYCLTNGVGA